MGEAAALEKDGVERDLQELLADAAALVRRGLPARAARVADRHRAGRPDVPRRRTTAGSRSRSSAIGTIDAVEQLTRYLERIRLDPAMADCRGVLAAQAIKPQARVLAEARGIACVEVDLAVLRGEREPDLTLFAA